MLPLIYHGKLLIVDDLWTSVGSANFDNRSFLLNDEANLNGMDREFAAVESGAGGGKTFGEGHDQ